MPALRVLLFSQLLVSEGVDAASGGPPSVTGGGIFPPPQFQQQGGDQWVVDPKSFEMVLGSAAPASALRLQRAFERFRDRVFDYGPAAPASTARCCGATGTRNCSAACESLSKLVVNVESSVDTFERGINESYSLRVDDHTASLNATTVFGAIRGLQSFSTLVQFNVTSATYTIFQTDVKDFPRFEFRGVMADTARNYISFGELRMMCDSMEQSRYNALHLHLTDVESWPIEIEGFPKLTQWLSFGNHPYNTAANYSKVHTYSIKQMQELVEYCEDRVIRIIPEVDMPGHFKAQAAYPEYFAEQDDPHGCATNASQICRRGLIDITTDHGFEIIEGIWKSLVSTFPGGEYHLGGDEVWAVPWANSTTVQKWIATHGLGDGGFGCPDDATVSCGSIGDIQPYFTRKVVSIIEKLRPGASIMGWNPGIGNFSRHTDIGAQYPNFTYSNWNGWDRKSAHDGHIWKESMAQMTDKSGGNASVILSGPFYVVEPKWLDYEEPNGTIITDHRVHTINTPLQMMHTDITNFTGGNKDKVRGAEVVVWGDAAKVDSGNLVEVAASYMAAMAIQLWSPYNRSVGHPTIVPINPRELITWSCEGPDFGLCHTLDQFRCTNLMRDIPAGNRFDGTGDPCSIPYERPPSTVWYRSPKLSPPLAALGGPGINGGMRSIAEVLREQLRENGIVPVA